MATTITIRELAQVFGIDRSNALKWCKRNGATIVHSRDPERGNQKESAVTRTEAKRLVALRKADGFEVGDLP
jgi:hypothetical protein